MIGSDSISVVKIRNILLVTMPTDPDDETISIIQDRVLASMERFQVKGLVMDVSTVETMDSFFARTIIETARMVQLMGGITIIAGIQPSVAITATQLGLDFGNIITALDVDMALDRLMEVQ